MPGDTDQTHHFTSHHLIMMRIYLLPLLFIPLITACSSIYYGSLEKIGIPKREVMLHRVEKARDTQEETKEQFSSALQQFSALTEFKGGDLEDIYNKLNDEYLASNDKAEEVRKRIADIEDVSAALFAEWEEELSAYSSASLKRSSERKLQKTRLHYKKLIAAMKQAEQKIEPVLRVLNDQVLYLKHNLNAQAIASLKNELGSVKADVSTLVAAMENSINEANAFIKTMDSK